MSNILTHPAFLFFTNVLDIVNFIVLILLIVALQKIRLELHQRAEATKRVEKLVDNALDNAIEARQPPEPKA